MNKTTKDKGINFIKTDERVLAKIKETIREKGKGWSPARLGRELGFSSTWGNYMIKGERRLSVNMLLKIAKKLNVEPASLLPNPDNPMPRMSFDEYIWFSIKEKLDKHIDEKLKKIIKKG